MSMTQAEADKIIAAVGRLSDAAVKRVVPDALNIDVRVALYERVKTLRDDAGTVFAGSTRWEKEVNHDFKERARMLEALADRISEAEG